MNRSELRRQVRVDIVHSNDDTAPRCGLRYAELVQFADPQIVRMIRRLQDEVREERRRDRGFDRIGHRDRSSFNFPGQETAGQPFGEQPIPDASANRGPDARQETTEALDWDRWDRGVELPSSRRF